MRVLVIYTVLLLALPVGAQQASTASSPPPRLPSDELNRELPHWLRFSGEDRLRAEGYQSGGFRPDNDDSYLLQRVRFNVSAMPAPWLKFFFQTQDARVFWRNQTSSGPPYQDTWDLRQAYVSAGDAEKSRVSLRVGRQEINLGEERLVGSTNWNNAARTFDAARATLHYRKFRLDAFASAVVVLRPGQVGSADAGNNLHGLYGGLVNVVPNSTIEPYVLWRLQPRLKSELGATGNLDMKVPGVRWVGKFRTNFDYNTDAALERGGLAEDHISAWAGHWVLGYTFNNVRWTPRALVEYNYASGDGNAKDGQRNTFDQLYPTAHDKYGLADQVGWKNIHHLRSGVEWKVRPKWAMASRYSAYWLADAHDALYNALSAVVARKADGSAGRWVGQELDFVTLYSVTKATQVGGGFSHIFPGTFLDLSTPGQSYSAPYILFATQF